MSNHELQLSNGELPQSYIDSYMEAVVQAGVEISDEALETLDRIEMQEKVLVTDSEQIAGFGLKKWFLRRRQQQREETAWQRLGHITAIKEMRAEPFHHPVGFWVGDPTK